MKIGGDVVQIETKFQVYFSLLVGGVYGLTFYWFQLVNSEAISVVALIFQAICFSGFWILFAFGFKHKRKQVMDHIASDSSIAFYGAAHQLIKTSVVSGVLYATENQLVFQPNNQDWIENSWTLDWENVENIQTYSSLGVVDLGVRIQTKGGMKFKFQVNQPRIWLQKLQTKIELKQVL